jgi:hypothetical protein
MLPYSKCQYQISESSDTVLWDIVKLQKGYTKTGRHDIAEILLKVALNTKNQIKSCH